MKVKMQVRAMGMIVLWPQKEETSRLLRVRCSKEILIPLGQGGPFVQCSSPSDLD